MCILIVILLIVYLALLLNIAPHFYTICHVNLTKIDTDFSHCFMAGKLIIVKNLENQCPLFHFIKCHRELKIFIVKRIMGPAFDGWLSYSLINFRNHTDPDIWIAKSSFRITWSVNHKFLSWKGNKIIWALKKQSKPIMSVTNIKADGRFWNKGPGMIQN